VETAIARSGRSFFMSAGHRKLRAGAESCKNSRHRRLDVGTRE